MSSYRKQLGECGCGAAVSAVMIAGEDGPEASDNQVACRCGDPVCQACEDAGQRCEECAAYLCQACGIELAAGVWICRSCLRQVERAQACELYGDIPRSGDASAPVTTSCIKRSTGRHRRAPRGARARSQRTGVGLQEKREKGQELGG
jgi:hypothetical protein